jgi:predicted nucleic acid-binding protein
MHAAFEFMSAIRNEIHQLGGRHSSWAAQSSESERIDIWPVPIDSEFLARYPTGNLPDIKAGDLLFLAMAAGDSQPLITEDDNLFQKAQQAGVGVFRIADYLTANCSR